jgi:thiol-disulfide isomerase/thioredoxin
MKKLTYVVLIVLLLLSVITSCSKQVASLTAVELLTLGEKYLLELDYEQAVVQFLNVIEIEPKNPRGYIGAAEAYIALGETDKAIDVLLEGQKILPGNADIQAGLDKLVPPVSAFGLTADNIITLQIGNPNMTLNGVYTAIDANGNTPQSLDGSTLVPLRGTLETIGGTVTYDGFTGIVSAKYGDNLAELKFDSTDARLNGETISLPVAAYENNGAMYCPVRLIADLCGGKANWDNATQTVTIKYNGSVVSAVKPAIIAPTPAEEIAPEPTPPPTPAPTPVPTPEPTPPGYEPHDIGYGNIGTFSTYDIYGNSVSESLFSGKPITFVVYWASWCPPCFNELPDMQGLVDKYGSNVNFVSIVSDYDDDPAYLTQLCEQYMRSFTNLQDASYSLYQPFDSGYVPTSLIVDSKGNILCEQIVGAYGSGYGDYIDNALRLVGAN